MYKAEGCPRTPPGAMLQRTFYYHCSFMYAAVHDISYGRGSIVLGQKKSGSVSFGDKYGQKIDLAPL